MDLKAHIRGIADFPKPGILFYDISTLLRDADAWQVAMGRMARAVRPHQPDLLAGIESRGFLIAAPLALKLGCGFIMLRKRGKLPGATVAQDYALEYGTDRIEMQADAVRPGAAGCPVRVAGRLRQLKAAAGPGLAVPAEPGLAIPARKAKQAVWSVANTGHRPMSRCGVGPCWPHRRPGSPARRPRAPPLPAH
jgi:adenine phosphoribosyltransferase